MHALGSALLSVGDVGIPKALLATCLRPGYLCSSWLSAAAFLLVCLSQRLIIIIIMSVMAVVVSGI